ncbi:malonyl-CoA decarboxylase domain-containing protein [Pseudorhodoferax sp.]|uniref:malonyl-CoA decarboxylase domain-containing protein n=1 Tax=Pseudorhodoferax sp. TaxID=1993553 RepID=UPI002DD67330|nr:malonyl-CoA decarboxylase family protein [Pseudorhodoferax sp.]
MLDEIRQAATRQRQARTLRALVQGSHKLLSADGESGGLVLAAQLLDRLDAFDDTEIGAWFDHLARELDPDPQQVLARAQAYADKPDAATLVALTQAVEPPRQELLRRLNRAPGGTKAILRLRRQLLRLLPRRPDLQAIEADLLHLLASWFNPGFLQMRQVDWNAPAQLLEKLIVHEAVHAIDGWDDLRRRLQPDRRCFAFFHPQLPDEPLIFVEVALLPEMPPAIAPLIDKGATPMAAERFRVAAFYSISNCEPGLRGVSLGNFLIKTVAQHLQRELPRLRTFCTLSPIPGFAAWLLADPAGPDFSALNGLRKPAVDALREAFAHLQQSQRGELQALQHAAAWQALPAADEAALQRLCAAYLLHHSPTPRGDPVARFHLDNGARLERINSRGNMAPKGLRQSFGLMVNYLYDLDRVEANHTRFRQGEVVRSRAAASLL